MRTPITPLPAPPSSPTVASRAPASTSAITTFIPSATKRSASALPMPAAPPVITATLPSRSCILVSPCSFIVHPVRATAICIMYSLVLLGQ